MCESRVVIEKGEGEEEVMAEAAKVQINANSVIVSDIFGKTEIIKNARVKEIDFLGHVVRVVKDED